MKETEIQAELPVAQAEILEREAEKQGCTVEELIVRCLVEYLDASPMPR